MKKRADRKYHYIATSRNMYRAEEVINGYYLEYNDALMMYRCNHPDGVPLSLMGYTPHRQALIHKVRKLG